MEFTNKIKNLSIRRSNVRTPMTKPLNKGSAYILMLSSLDQLITEINNINDTPTKLNILNTYSVFHPNALMVNFDPSSKDRIKNYYRTYAPQINENCESISIIKPKLENYRNYNAFISFHKFFEIANRSKKKHKAEKMYTAFKDLLDSIEYENKYIVWNLEYYPVYKDTDIKESMSDNKDILHNFLYILKYKPELAKEVFAGYEILFYSTKGTFKLDLNEYDTKQFVKLIFNIKRIHEVAKDEEVVDDSEESIKLKNANSLLDKMDDETVGELDNELTEYTDTEDSVKIIMDKIKSHRENNTIKVSSTEKKYLNKVTRVNNDSRTYEEMLDNENTYSYTPTLLPVPDKSGYNKNTLKSFNESYEKNVKDYHMMGIANHFAGTTTVPLYLMKVSKKDTSDVHNEKETYSYIFRDPSDNKSFTVSIDVPKVINGNRLKINGTAKTLVSQILPHPIVKLGEQVMITTNYNKMFVEKLYGTGSSLLSNRFIRMMNRLSNVEHDNITFGSVYESNFAADKLPVSVLELSSVVMKITDVKELQEKSITDIENDNYVILFSISDIKKFFGENTISGDEIPMGVYRGDIISLDTVNDTVSCKSFRDNEPMTIYDFLLELDDKQSLGIRDALEEVKTNTKIKSGYVKLLGAWTPMVFILMYTEGLFSVMEYNKTKYRILGEDEINKRVDKFKYLKLKMKNGALVIDISKTEDAIFYYPLSTLDLSDFDVSDLENKEKTSEIMVDFSGGKVNFPLYVMNFRNLLIDPITKDVLKRLNQPTDFMGVLLYANNLLASSTKMEELDLKNTRIRCAETVPAMVYKELCNAYEEYSAKKQRGSTRAEFSMSKTRVLSSLMQLPNVEEYSELNPFQQVSKERSISSKGHVGKNEARAYTWKTRLFHDSYMGIISMPSAYGASIGIVKQMSISPNIVDLMGFVDIADTPEKIKALPNASIMSPSEGLTVGSINHNDPPRDAMDMSQKNHIVSVANSTINYTTNSFDRTLPHLATDFCKIAEQDGVVEDLTNEYITIKYKDGTLRTFKLNNVAKNSAKGKYVKNDMVTELSIGKKFKAGSPICYNDKFFKYSPFDDALISCTGHMSNVFIMSSALAFEDSVLISDTFSKDMATPVVKRKGIKITKHDNILEYKMPEEIVVSSDSLMTYVKNSDEDLMVAQLLDNMDISDISKHEASAKVNGSIQSVRVYYACDENELHPSILKMINALKKYYMVKEKNLYRSSGEDIRKHSELPVRIKADSKFNGEKVYGGEVLIEYYYEYIDYMSNGDKCAVFTALKGIDGKVEPVDKMPKGHVSGLVADIVISPFGPAARKTFVLYNEGLSNIIMKNLTEMCIDFGKKGKK